MNKDEIEARALELYPERKRQNKKGTGEYDANLPRRKAYIKGWTDAQPTLPEDSRIETGKYAVTLETIQAIAEALGMTVDIVDERLRDLAPLKVLT